MKHFLYIGILFLGVALLAYPGTTDVTLYEQVLKGFALHEKEQFIRCFHYQCAGHSTNYPPLYLFYFYMMTKLPGAQTLSYFWMEKLLVYGMYLLTIFSYGLFGATAFYSKAKGFWSGIFIGLLSWSLVINGPMLGYVDVFFIPFFIGAIISLYKKAFFIFGLLYAISFLTKWIPAILLPFTLVFVYRTYGWKASVRFFIGVFIVVTAVGYGVAGWKGLPYLAESFFSATANEYISAAPNVAWILQQVAFYISEKFSGVLSAPSLYVSVVEQPDAIWKSTIFVLKTLYIVIYALILNKIWRMKASIATYLYGSSLVSIGYFLFAPGVHENHLMLGVVTMTLLRIVRENSKTLFYLVDACSAASMLLFLGVWGMNLGLESMRWIFIYLLGVVAMVYFVRLIRSKNFYEL